jgi:hypothetical protein
MRSESRAKRSNTEPQPSHRRLYQHYRPKADIGRFDIPQCGELLQHRTVLFHSRNQASPLALNPHFREAEKMIDPREKAAKCERRSASSCRVPSVTPFTENTC